MRRAAILAALAIAGCHKPAPPAPAPSVLVRLAPARQGTAPDVVAVYGVATPATGALVTVDLNQAAQLNTVDVAPGTAVRAGQRLITYVTDPAALGAYRQAAVAVTAAQAQAAHARQLLAQELGTRDQVAQADANLRSARTALTALAQQGAGVPAGAVTAPFDGVVVSVPVAAGDNVAAGAPLVTVARQDALVISAGFDSTAAQRVRAGQPATVEALADGQRLQGRVLRVASAINPQTRLIHADIAAPAGLVLGDSFRASVTVGQVSGWLAPHAAVLNDAKGDYLFQVAGAKARRIDVRVVGASGDTDVVQGALDPRLPLVVDGAGQLENGAPVRAAGKP